MQETPAVQAALQSAIVSISFGLPRQSRDLKAEAAGVETKNNAARGTVRTAMFYFKKKSEDGKSDIDGLDLLKRFQTRFKASTIMTFAPYPYSGGFYLLPGANIGKYRDAVDLFTKEKETVWMKWADDEYPMWRESAPERMGNLFDKGDFPSLGECSERFTCETTEALLATGDQWKRIAALTPDIVATMEEKSNEKIKGAVAAATASLWVDVMKPIEHIVTTFSKDKYKIHDSMIGNILAIVEMVPALNMENDPNLAQLAADAKETLGKIKPEELRKSAELRSETLNTAKKLMAQFAPLQRKLNV